MDLASCCAARVNYGLLDWRVAANSTVWPTCPAAISSRSAVCQLLFFVALKVNRGICGVKILVRSDKFLAPPSKTCTMASTLVNNSVLIRQSSVRGTYRTSAPRRAPATRAVVVSATAGIDPCVGRREALAAALFSGD